MTGATPWGPWMRLAFGALAMPPHVFWRLSLIEWAMILKAHGFDADGALNSDALKRLIEAYPDKQESKHG